MTADSRDPRAGSEPLPLGLVPADRASQPHTSEAPFGAEARVLRPRRAAPADTVRATRAEVNLGALRHNFHVLTKHAGATALWPVLKADAYGHGAPAVARTLERAGAKGFCVALVEEAIELRDAGIRVPILVMGGYYGNHHEEVLHHGLMPVVYEAEQLDAFARLARFRGGDPLDVHVKIDTGMARLGVRPEELPAFADDLLARPELRAYGAMTHFACADAAEPDHAREQVRVFDESLAALRVRGVKPAVRHAANSAAVLRAVGLYDVARPGLAIFGVAPRTADDRPLSDELRPVLRVRSEVIALRTLKAGEGAGYGHLWRAERPSTIATIAMGYADGFHRALTGKGSVLVRGKRVPLVGAVSMDMAMIDVTDVEGISLHDEVVILGAQEGPLGKDEITADAIASWSGKISWEILCGISRRVPRFYREP
jgi:alanine racemase